MRSSAGVKARPLAMDTPSKGISLDETKPTKKRRIVVPRVTPTKSQAPCAAGSAHAFDAVANCPGDGGLWTSAPLGLQRTRP